MFNVKKFVKEYKTEIAFVAGAALTAAVLATIYGKILDGERIVIVSAFTNKINDDLLILIQKANNTTETVTIPRVPFSE